MVTNKGKKNVDAVKTIKEVIKATDKLPVESPFGDTSSNTRLDEVEGNTEIISKVKRLMKLKGYDEETAIKYVMKKLRKDGATKEVILIPEKTLSDVPKKSKLGKLPREAEKIKGKISNIVKIHQKQLDSFMKKFNQSSSSMSSQFLETIAPAFLAHEDAMNYVTVALRDGLSYDGEIDLEILPMLEWAARISYLAVFLENINMPEDVKNRYLRLSTSRAVEKAFTTKHSPYTKINGADGKVAGIVTSISDDSKKVKNSLELVKKLQDKAKGVKVSQNDNSPLGAVKTKNGGKKR